jgi:preprotein translocase subunit SecB
MNETTTTTTTNQKTDPSFGIEKIYVKDISFEAPNVPEIFKEEWKPAIALNMDIALNKLSSDVYEVVLKITVTNKINEKMVFLVEISQAGLFTIKGFQDKQVNTFAGVMCPQILFPYAREAISDLIGRGGFPPLYLAPINFESLYQQKNKAELDKETK